MEVAGRALLAFMANVCCQLVEGVVESGALQKNKGLHHAAPGWFLGSNKQC